MPPPARTLRFAFDVQCPYAYLASKRVRQLVAAAAAAPASLEHFPVLLGGLYADSKAPQGKGGSASDVMAPAKRALNAADLAREAERWGVKLVYNSRHPVRTVKAQRLLVATTDAAARARLCDALFDAYWQHDVDLSDDGQLLAVAGAVLPELRSVEALNLLAEKGKDGLRSNTTWCSSRGAFGVPSFFVMEEGKPEPPRLWFGQDRTYFVARELGVPASHPLANPLRLFPTKPGDGAGKTLEFFFDFGSPWAFLGATQVRRVAELHGAKLVYRPILVGILFKSVGTPNVPMFEMSDAQRAHFSRDLDDWRRWWNVPEVRFPDAFPLRTVTPSRVAILEPRAVDAIYRAAWQQNRNVGDEAVLAAVLTEAGFDGARLVERAKTDQACKDALARNTKDAVDRGLCGVPSFSVDFGPIVWGQDRLHVV